MREQYVEDGFYLIGMGIGVLVVVAVIAIIIYALTKSSSPQPPSASQGPVVVKNPQRPVPGNPQIIGNEIPNELYISCINGVMAGREYPIGPHPIIIGRDHSALIRYSDGKNGVSGIHCKIYKDSSGKLLLVDCDSTYGTMLKGYGKLAPQRPVQLKVGSTFYVGAEVNGFKITSK